MHVLICLLVCWEETKKSTVFYLKSASLPRHHVSPGNTSQQGSKKQLQGWQLDWEKDEGKETQGRGWNWKDGGKCTLGETIGPACMNTQSSRAGVSQSGACAVNPDSCKQSGRQTGLEVERLSQIRTQCTDQPGIHMCLLCPDMPQRQCCCLFRCFFVLNCLSWLYLHSDKSVYNSTALITLLL